MTIADDQRLGPLAALVGTWAGSGHGVYPTIAPFDYLEEVTFTDPGTKPFLFYVQRTRAVDDGRPLHAEAGYLRWAAGAPEWVIAQPSGLAEVHQGTAEVTAEGLLLSFATVGLAATGTAKRVDSVSRTLVIAGDHLEYRVDMAAVGEAPQLHLTAALTRS